jgi:hypothetical protein
LAAGEIQVHNLADIQDKIELANEAVACIGYPHL